MVACESRAEWLLMYSRGVPIRVIARWCRVEPRRVRRAVDRQTRVQPAWFDRCLLVHDQPAQATAAERRKSLGEMWWEQYDDLVASTRGSGGVLPRQNDSRRSRGLYLWILKQRRALDAGTLATDRLEALDGLGEWKGRRAEDPEVLWERRFKELRHFVGDRGRFPMYDPVERPDERALAVWFGRQRTWHRRSRLRVDRREHLDRELPGWFD